MGFVERLESEMKRNNLSRYALAKKSGVTIYAISGYFNRDHKIPRADNAVAMAQVLGVTVEYLITGESDLVKIVKDNPYKYKMRCNNKKCEVIIQYKSKVYDDGCPICGKGKLVEVI